MTESGGALADFEKKLCYFDSTERQTDMEIW
jgi:hypothetical protein